MNQNTIVLNEEEKAILFTALNMYIGNMLFTVEKTNTTKKDIIKDNINVADNLINKIYSQNKTKQE